jgi:hypothetical protein
MTRKLLILLSVTLLVSAGCGTDGALRRVEVWKQQVILDPPPAAAPQLVGPTGSDAIAP